MAEDIVSLEQALYGYDNGHRLLASSMKLDPQDEATLLTLSDVAPGISIREIEEYWTGVPLKNSKVYALMKTWGAYEVQRPGAVWSHVLFIKLSDIAKIQYFHRLKEFFGQFTPPHNLSHYKSPIRLDLLENSLFFDFKRDFDYNLALDSLRAVYGTGAGRLHTCASDAEDILFAIWSQQWPRLRREFSFRTAGQDAKNSYSKKKFDYQIIRAQAEVHDHSGAEAWEELVINDWSQPAESDFRKFLWKYGADINNGINSFAFLSNLYLDTKGTNISGRKLISVFKKVEKHFPDSGEANALKKDLLSFQGSQYSLLPKATTESVLGLLVESSDCQEDIIRYSGLLEHLNQVTPSHEILDATEAILRKHPTLGEQLVAAIANNLEPKDLTALTITPGLYTRLVLKNPALLNSNKIQEIPISNLLSVLKEAKLSKTLQKNLLKRVIYLDQPKLVRFFLDLNEDLVLKVLCEAISKSHKSYSTLSSVWLENVLTAKRTEFLKSGCIEKIKSLDTLSHLAALLGYTHPDVLEVGAGPWSKALAKATGHLEGKEKELFHAFLLALAFETPDSKAEILFEAAFETAHEGLRQKGSLWIGYSLLSTYLPTFFIWFQGDPALRLRLAVVGAYLEKDLNPSSFQKLTKNKKLLEKLLSVLGYTEKEKVFKKHFKLS